MIQFLTDPQNLLSVGVAVAVFATVFTLLSSMGGGVGLGRQRDGGGVEAGGVAKANRISSRKQSKIRVGPNYSVLVE